MTVVPESDFMGKINANTRTTILLCAIAFTAATAIGIFTARWISSFIEAITQASEDMANGHLDRQVKTSSLIELKKLGNSFNSMAGQLKESFETLEDKVTERTSELATANAEIATLNSRLTAENMRMSAELYILKQMQQLILPKQQELEEIEDLDIAGFMEPADEVGGDYYDVLFDEGVVTDLHWRCHRTWLRKRYCDGDDSSDCPHSSRNARIRSDALFRYPQPHYL